MRTIISLPAVETPSLMLREIEARDAAAFCNFMMQEDYQRFIAIRFNRPGDIAAFVGRAVSRQTDERRGVFHLAAEEKPTGEAIGDGFLIIGRPGSVEVGWGLHPAMWQMGLGTEIGRALLGLAFERLGARQAWCKVMSGNTASARLAQRIGMMHAATHPEYPVAAGQHGKVDVFVITAEAYFESGY
ncbi:MAG: GNAT family N-acetyltransferase [Aestuariivirga sp.]|uniref:GNAT family N-acetyltransferase n=1 Tax=Aestuariivirga sp. TaxID=2650926 RepID=UPI0038D1DFEE